MIDGIKICRLKFRENVFGHCDLKNNVFDEVDDITGELIKKTAIWHSLRFVSKIGKGGQEVISVSGSLHKFWNSYQSKNSSKEASHNHNQFALSDVFQALAILDLEFDGILTSSLNNLEFGLNILTGTISPEDILRFLICYKNGIPFREYEKKEKKLFYEAETTEFYLKVYHKSLQYGLTENILRIEVKVKSMNFLRSKNIDIRQLGDLRNAELYPLLGQKLSKVWESVICGCPSVSIDKLPLELRSDYNKFLTSFHWRNFEKTSAGRMQRQRDKESFKKLIEDYRQDIYPYEAVSNLIPTLWNALMEK